MGQPSLGEQPKMALSLFFVAALTRTSPFLHPLFTRMRSNQRHLRKVERAANENSNPDSAGVGVDVWNGGKSRTRAAGRHRHPHDVAALQLRRCASDTRCRRSRHLGEPRQSTAVAGDRHGKGCGPPGLRHVRTNWCRRCFRRTRPRCCRRTRPRLPGSTWRPTISRELTATASRPLGVSTTWTSPTTFASAGAPQRRSGGRGRRIWIEGAIECASTGSTLAIPDGPLVDITAADVPRVFPTRYRAALAAAAIGSCGRMAGQSGRRSKHGLRPHRRRTARQTRCSSHSASGGWCGNSRS